MEAAQKERGVWTLEHLLLYGILNGLTGRELLSQKLNTFVNSMFYDKTYKLRRCLKGV